VLKEVKDVFNDLCIIPHLSWLFQLRGMCLCSISIIMLILIRF
jgi:hypothetical protein